MDRLARKDSKKEREAPWNNAVESFKQDRTARVLKTLSSSWKDGRPSSSSLNLDLKQLGEITHMQGGTEDVDKLEDVLRHGVHL